eukprot:667687-Prymnesium_polylepis.4
MASLPRRHIEYWQVSSFHNILLSRFTLWNSLFHSQHDNWVLTPKNSSGLGHFVRPSRPEGGPLNM